MPFRIGIVGCGSVARRHAAGAAASSKVAIVACADVLLERAEGWARSHGCERAYGDHLAMVREHELDGVLLATWPNLHREQVLGCLDAGVRAILCEKALALNGAEAVEILTAAREAGALVTEGYMYRHHPAVATLDELLESGRLGALDSIHAAFSIFDPEEASPEDASRDWRQRAELGGGAPYDIACYCVDACNRFAGARPLRVQAFTSESERYGTVSRVFGLVEFANGVVGTVESSMRADFNHELRLNGTLGHARLPVAWRIDFPTEVVASRSVGWGLVEEKRFPAPAVDAYRLELEAFAAAAQGQAAPAPTLEESVVTAFTVDALLASARGGRAVEIGVPEGVLA